MRLGLNRITGLDRFLTSWKSQDDPGTGDYFAKMNPTGSPQGVFYKGSTLYWRSAPWPWPTSSSSATVSWGFNYDSVNNEDEVSYAYSIDDPSIISRLVVGNSGLLQKLMWNDGDLQWKEFWSVPKYQCDNYRHCGAYDATELATYTRKSIGFLGHKRQLAITISSVMVTLFMVCLMAYICLMKKRKTKVKRKLHNQSLYFTGTKGYWKGHELEESSSHPDLLIFDLGCIIAATDNFSPINKLGQGGFGSVFKGQLSNGQEVAIKRLSYSSAQGIEEFKNEVLLIAKLQHRNLVKLFGCCIQGEEKMLIYEYMPNKSLDFFIFDHTRSSLLNWGKRFEIIIGIARGILYLHQDSRLKIIHRDLKTSNVLLDGEMNPKISDFGIARISNGDQIQDTTTRVVGTYGYMSPEYAIFGKFSTKSDVFSFGVILLEIVSGKKNNSSYQRHDSLTLIGHVWELWREDRVLDIVDSSMNDSFVSHEVLRCIQIGLLCVQEDAMDRPTMLAVLLMLSCETTLPSPKQPAFIFRRPTNNLGSITGERFYSINDVTITEFEAR
ncbi:hypothetical protein CMV_026244 [Castanea mollissima]|uniref:non-specific serine/threonine protein kinase n=1 Tax=Castanea mollissima TaxID=60419 RepID=A0A8J4QMD7_9ROSI|nr:hypothetical protein CMV_026244 [Castanea mollissima]